MPSGGKRVGAGRKPVEKPKVTKCFRVDEEQYLKAQEIHGKKLNEKVNKFIHRLSKSNKITSISVKSATINKETRTASFEVEVK